MTIIVADASAIVALLLDNGAAGRWSAQALSGADLAAPHLLPFEVANVIRRHATARLIGHDVAEQSMADLADLPIEYWPFETLAPRVWALRPNLTSYDASYVALGELLKAPVATLDERIAKVRHLKSTVRSPRTWPTRTPNERATAHPSL